MNKQENLNILNNIKKFDAFVNLDKNKKVINNVRTNLLLFIDEEHNKYLKNCNIRLNNETPKEILKKFCNDFTISFSNPTIHSANYRSQSTISRKRNNFNDNFQTSNANPNVNTKRNSENLNENYDEKLPTNKMTKISGIFYFTKFMHQIGKDFFHSRKISVSQKKFEKEILVSSKTLRKITIETDLGILDDFSNVNSSKTKLYLKKLTTKNFFKLPKYMDSFLVDKEDREATVIQNNFNKLQEIVHKIKIIGNKKYDKKLNNKNNFYSNFRKSFNDELFEILEFKGIKFENKKLNQNKFKKNYYSNEHNINFDNNENNINFKSKIILAKSDPNLNKLDKEYSDDFANFGYDKIYKVDDKYSSQKISRKINSNSNELNDIIDIIDTNENTRNFSPERIPKIKKFSSEKINFREYSLKPNSNFISDSSENEFNLKINSSNHSYSYIFTESEQMTPITTPTNTDLKKKYGNNKLLELINCKNNKEDSENSGSEASKYSFKSNYGSNYTISNESDELDV